MKKHIKRINVTHTFMIRESHIEVNVKVLDINKYLKDIGSYLFRYV